MEICVPSSCHSVEWMHRRYICDYPASSRDIQLRNWARGAESSYYLCRKVAFSHCTDTVMIQPNVGCGVNRYIGLFTRVICSRDLPGWRKGSACDF